MGEKRIRILLCMTAVTFGLALLIFIANALAKPADVAPVPKAQAACFADKGMEKEEEREKKVVNDKGRKTDAVYIVAPEKPEKESPVRPEQSVCETVSETVNEKDAPEYGTVFQEETDEEQAHTDETVSEIIPEEEPEPEYVYEADSLPVEEPDEGQVKDNSSETDMIDEENDDNTVEETEKLVFDDYQDTSKEKIDFTEETSTDEGLTPDAGINYGPSGLETYYNMDMSGLMEAMDGGWAYQDCINKDIVDEALASGGYWVRDDGVKMFGDYIIVAAELSQHPRGSIVPSSLGDAIVLDTGLGGCDWLDIATIW